MFYRYLEVSRGKELTEPVKEGVDTLLMYLYRALNHVNSMEKLASSANSCIVVFVVWLLFILLFTFLQCLVRYVISQEDLCIRHTYFHDNLL